MSTTVYAEDLENFECTDPKCTHEACILVLSSKCHPGAGADVIYFKGTGVLGIICHVCERPAAAIKVARKGSVN